VPPRKNRPVLFEVFARTQRARGHAPATRPTAPASTPAPVPPAAPTAAPPPAPTRIKSAAAPIGSALLENGRLHVALGWPHLAVAGVILIVALTVAFQIGRRSAQPSTQAPDDLSKLLATPPAPEAPKKEVAAPKPGQGRSAGPVVTPLNPTAEPAAKPKPPPVQPAPTPVQPPSEPPKAAKPAEEIEFAAGSFYVVIQHFRTRDRERATAARDFLSTKGIACVIRPGGGDLELIATEAFSSDRQAQDLVRRILDFGKEYRVAGGGYDFASAKARKF
jgi:hypothetical protein